MFEYNYLLKKYILNILLKILYMIAPDSSPFFTIAFYKMRLLRLKTFLFPFISISYFPRNPIKKMTILNSYFLLLIIFTTKFFFLFKVLLVFKSDLRSSLKSV